MLIRALDMYSEFLWSVISRIGTKYEEMLRISPPSVRIRENTDQKNSEYNTFQAVLVYYFAECFY